MPSLDRLTVGLAERWRRIAWVEPANGRSRAREAGRTRLRACGEAVRSYQSDQLEMRANALTYRTLLSLVPLLAVVFSLFTAFGGLRASEEALRGVIAENLAPGPRRPRCSTCATSRVARRRERSGGSGSWARSCSRSP